MHGLELRTLHLSFTLDLISAKSEPPNVKKKNMTSNRPSTNSKHSVNRYSQNPDMTTSCPKATSKRP